MKNTFNRIKTAASLIEQAGIELELFDHETKSDITVGHRALLVGITRNLRRLNHTLDQIT